MQAAENQGVSGLHVHPICLHDEGKMLARHHRLLTSHAFHDCRICLAECCRFSARLQCGGQTMPVHVQTDSIGTVSCFPNRSLRSCCKMDEFPPVALPHPSSSTEKSEPRPDGAKLTGVKLIHSPDGFSSHLPQQDLDHLDHLDHPKQNFVTSVLQAA